MLVYEAVPPEPGLGPGPGLAVSSAAAELFASMQLVTVWIHLHAAYQGRIGLGPEFLFFGPSHYKTSFVLLF